MSTKVTSRLREFASATVIMVLLAGVLGFYYLKYVPERRREFNRNAFLELSQIQKAFQSRTQAYKEAIRNTLSQDKIDTNGLIKFGYNPQANAVFKKGNWVGPNRFDRYPSNPRWQMFYPVFCRTDSVNTAATLIYPLYIDLDTLMTDLISNYKDVFDGYLLIRDLPPVDNREIVSKINYLPPFLGSKRREYSKDIGDNQKVKIIYQSGDLSMDYLVNPDSLLKKNAGASLLNIQDITIAGNPYKIFLFPFEISDQKLILTGLISDANYSEANQKIPFKFFAIFTILLLLLLIHLPILRIYILSRNERVRDRDIRLIIGSYFIAAFFGFFLFTRIFLEKEQSVQNKTHLRILSDRITNTFYAELDSINRQLHVFDSTLQSLGSQYKPTLDNDRDAFQKKNGNYLRALTGRPDTAIIREMDSLLKPRVYPYPNNVFWISESGNWVARWGFKKSLNNAPLINVQDRLYFREFKSRKDLQIPDNDDSIAIQPTLSKLEGDYVISVAIKSNVNPVAVRIQNDSSVPVNPFLIGLSSQMPSMTSVILPPGYGFSIIDPSGDILFDAKPGRAMLANLMKETEDPEGIRQSAIYHNERYFENFVLRGRNVAMLSRPLNRMPYQLLVYYNLGRSDKFQEHLIGLSSGLIGSVICLLILSTLINQWSKTKTRMLESRSHHFEWLHPSADPLKQKYYVHLIRWMLLLFGIYLLAWFVMEAWAPQSEFSLLFISLLFPFYIALHYYELRERYYDVHENRTGINWYFSRPSLLLRGTLLTIIILINCLTSLVKYSMSLALPVLLTQLVWAGMIAWSTYRFRQHMVEENILKEPDTHLNIENPVFKYKIPVAYIWAILTSVILISVVPASGIFWLFFRQEKGLYLNTDHLIMARQIDLRNREINQHLTEFKWNPANSADQTDIRAKKFSRGIYMISGRTTYTDSSGPPSLLNYPSPEYIRIHKQIFPTDTLALAWVGPTQSAYDGSWYFAKEDGSGKSASALLSRDRRDGGHPAFISLSADSTADWNTAGLMSHSFSCMGTAFPIFFIVGLCFSLALAYFLTLSLTRRIFLMDLQIVNSYGSSEVNIAEKYYGQSGLRPEMSQLIVDTCQPLSIPSLDPAHNQIPIQDPDFPDLKDIYHFEKKLPMSRLEAIMPRLINMMEPVYSALWKTLTERQKFILYDFALDGFANYKAGKQLQELMAKGFLFFDDLRLTVMTLSFQEYILQNKEDPDINMYMVQSSKEDTWRKFRTPLLIVLTAIGIFIFITQEDIYKKITGLLATLTSLLPLLNNLFNKPAAKGS